MKYRIKRCPSPAVMAIQLSEQLTDKYITDCPVEPGADKDLYQLLDSCIGVTGVLLSKYEVCIIRGDAFKWDDVLTEVLERLKMWFQLHRNDDSQWEQLPDVDTESCSTKYERGKVWFAVGPILRIVNDRFRCWCLHIQFGTKGIAIPAWPYREKR